MPLAQNHPVKPPSNTSRAVVLLGSIGSHLIGIRHTQIGPYAAGDNQPTWVDSDGRFHYRGVVDDAEHVWPNARDVASDWWSDSTLRSKREERRTEAHNLLDDLMPAGDRGALDVIQALVDAATSMRNLTSSGPALSRTSCRTAATGTTSRTTWSGALDSNHGLPLR